MGINVLVFGAGAREQAIAEAVLRSSHGESRLLGKLFLAEPCFAKHSEVIEFDGYEDLAQKCVEKKIELAIFGPEKPLCDGVVDIFKSHGINCIGVNKEWSKLESSKLFGKKFMEKHGIKTAKYSVVTEKSLPNYDKLNYPIVIKADGLCGGKGVVIANNKAFAEKTITDFLGGKFGENSKTILLEEYLQGEELSLMSLWDGKTLLNFAPSRDFKKLNKSPSAPNTGGMGAFCPVKLNSFMQNKLEEYQQKLEKALKSEKADFVGFIYSGLIWSKDNWQVLEYNVRLGDPEAQVTLEHLETDFLTVLNSAVKQDLDKVVLKYNSGYSACLILACQGYPKDLEYQKVGEKIYIPEPNMKTRDIKVFYAGVEKDENGQLFSKGGRVLSLCTTALNTSLTFPILKEFANSIKMEHKYFRQDIEIE